ncbi:hypothetical protein TYRP_009664, partial [Tyrophagus putrescentiae]
QKPIYPQVNNKAKKLSPVIAIVDTKSSSPSPSSSSSVELSSAQLSSLPRR